MLDERCYYTRAGIMDFILFSALNCVLDLNPSEFGVDPARTTSKASQTAKKYHKVAKL